jgi:chromosome segregation ATPase
MTEENELEQIHNILENAPQILEELQMDFEKENQEVFTLKKQERELSKELEELDKSITFLKKKKDNYKQDLDTVKKKVNVMDVPTQIRKINRELDDDTLRIENLPMDKMEVNKWSQKLSILDQDLLKYFRIYMDLAEASFFELDEKKSKAKTKNQEEKKNHFNELLLIEKTPNQVSQIIKELENWINLFVFINKRNAMGNKYHLNKSLFNRRKSVRRSSRRASRRASVLHSFFNPINLKKVD